MNGFFCSFRSLLLKEIESDIQNSKFYYYLLLYYLLFTIYYFTIISYIHNIICNITFVNVKERWRIISRVSLSRRLYCTYIYIMCICNNHARARRLRPSVLLKTRQHTDTLAWTEGRDKGIRKLRSSEGWRGWRGRIRDRWIAGGNGISVVDHIPPSRFDLTSRSWNG